MARHSGEQRFRAFWSVSKWALQPYLGIFLPPWTLPSQ